MNLTKRPPSKTHRVADLVIMLFGALAFAGIVFYGFKSAQEYGQTGALHADELIPLSILSFAGFNSFAYMRWRQLKDEISRRRQAEQTLRESEKKYRDLVEDAPVGIVVSSFDGHVVEVNSTLVRMHGYESKDQFLKSRVSDRFCNLKDRERLVAAVWDSGKANSLEVETRRRDGSPFWTSVTAVPRTTETGEQLLVEVIQDITVTRKAEDVSRQSEARYRELAESISDVFFAMDRDLKYMYWNKASEELTGIPAEQAVGKHFFEIFPENEATRSLRSLYMEAMATGQPRHFTTMYPGRQCILHEVSAYPSSSGVVVFAKDVTQREQTRQSLVATSKHQEVVLATVPDIIMEVDADRFYTWANRAGLDFFGDDVVGKEASFYFEGAQITNDMVRPIFAGSEDSAYLESLQRRKDGAKRLLAWWCHSIKGPNGMITGALSVAQDITDRKSDEAILSHLASFPELNPNPIVELDSSGQVTYTNKAARALFPGLGPEDNGHPFLAGWRALTKELAAESAHQVSREVQVGDSSYLQSVARLPSTGSLRFYAIDVTQLHLTQKALEASERYLNTLVENAPIGIAVLAAPDGNFLGANAAFCRTLGYTKAELSDFAFRDIVHPDDLDASVWNFDGLDSCKATQSALEKRCRRRDGAVIYGRVSISALPNATGKPSHYVIHLEDVTDRKRAEESLLAERENFLNSLDVCPLGIRIVAPDATTLYANQALLEMFGCSNLEEWESVPVPERFAPESAAFLTEITERLRRGDAVSDYEREVTAVRKDGRAIDVFLRRRGTIWNGRRVAEVIYEDITERKEAERAVRESERKYRDLVENLPVGVVISSIDGRVIEVNETQAKMFGYESKVNFAESTVADRFHDLKDRERWVSLVKERGKTENFEIRARRKDGSLFWASLTAIQRVTETGERQFLTVSQDITEPRRMRERIEQAAEEWRRTFDSITDAVSIQDKDFKLVRVNKAYARMFKKEPRELLGKTCYHLVHGSDCPVEACPHLKTMQTGAPAGGEFFEPHLGIHLEMTTSPILNESGEIYGTVHVARDITRRVEIEECLRQTDRLASIGELAAGVAHEVNNPLTTVIGFSELLMERELAEDIKGDLALVHGEARRAAGIVRNLLTFARKHESAMQPLNIENVIRDVLSLRAYEQKVNNIEVITHFESGLPEVIADYSQLQQVFLNIVINAEYFMRESHGRGTLRVFADGAADMVRVSIADDGPGISPENISHVFDPFFTTKEVGKGTGLGLSICHGIVTELRGRIYAESEMGNGAAFVVELPIHIPIRNDPRVVPTG